MTKTTRQNRTARTANTKNAKTRRAAQARARVQNRYGDAQIIDVEVSNPSAANSNVRKLTDADRAAAAAARQGYGGYAGTGRIAEQRTRTVLNLVA